MSMCRRSNLKSSATSFFMVLLLSIPKLHASDVLLVHGRVYTAASDGTWAQALALTGDHIDAVGSDAKIMGMKTAATKVIDLKGKMVIPGVTDNHVHIWFGSLALHGFNFSTPEGNITPDDRDLFVSKIKEFAASHPQATVLIGRATFSNGVGAIPAPSKSILDEAVPDRPLVIHATSEHTLFVNTKALAMAGIGDEPLADPAEEMYVGRDAHGHPTGILREAAMEAMERGIPDPGVEEKVKILMEGEQYLNSFGITSVVLATGGLKDLEAYDALRKRGVLTLRMRQAFGTVAVNHHLNPKFLADLETARSTYHDDWISANMVKFFMDGAPSAPLYSTEEYSSIVKALDTRGYQVMSHALSAAAAKVVLDGDEAVEKANGPKDRRFRMEHAGRIDPQDLPRFAALKIIPSMQPAFCCYLPNPSLPGYTPGKSNQWNTLEKSGATLEFSSDWPCSWPPSPILGIQQGTERYLRRRVTSTGALDALKSDDDPEERVTAEQGLLAYTRNAAFANKTEKKLGTLEAGKLADLVVLSQDFLAVPSDQIGKTKVLTTMVGGKVVYGKLE